MAPVEGGGGLQPTLGGGGSSLPSGGHVATQIRGGRGDKTGAQDRWG